MKSLRNIAAIEPWTAKIQVAKVNVCDGKNLNLCLNCDKPNCRGYCDEVKGFSPHKKDRRK